MMKHNKILILSGTLGDGHMQAAKAIVEASQLYKPGVAVKVIDFMEWIHPRMHVIERYCFKQWLKHFPSLYGYLFQKTRADNKISQLLKQFRSHTLRRLSMLLQEEKPSVIVSTFPPAAAAVSLLKQKGLTGLPTVTVITDHTDHSYWIHPQTDMYLVGSERVRQALQKKGIPGGNIVVTGIPVRPSYSKTLDKTQLREKFGISPSSFVVLVAGGGWGMIDKAFVDLLQPKQFPANVTFVIICGRNEKLLGSLQEALPEREHVILQGYTEEMYEWMALADVLLTKPGGLTTSEALALRLPMLLFEPKLGQERDNADYLIGIGAAKECGMSELRDELYGLVYNRQRLHEMSERAGTCGQSDSARLAVGQIMDAGFTVAAAI
jgi:processive 1,2-diacylglycerol beta-glucosyltransferase